jgi:hypothetical protein
MALQNVPKLVIWFKNKPCGNPGVDPISKFYFVYLLSCRILVFIRVTGLGEFLSIGRLLSLTSVLKITDAGDFFGLLFSVMH